MNYTILTYGIYLVLSIGLTIWVGRTLFTNGRKFLVDIFHQDHQLADSVNKLLLVGFYLVNFGYAVLNMTVKHEIFDLRFSLEKLSIKIGGILLILGAMHFVNLIGLYKLRKKAQVDVPHARTAAA